jgi:Putative MetA-pathway of phenol degradation
MRCFLLLLFVCVILSAQEIGELSTERPGFTTPSGMVGFGVLQLEEGNTFESAHDGGSRLGTFSLPQALVRFGLSDALELRFSTNGYEWQYQAARSTVSGPNDYVLGAKMRVVKQGTVRPEVSVVGGLSLPAAGSVVTSSGHDPLFTLATYKDLPDKFSLAASANMASVSDPQGRYFASGESVWGARSIRAGVSVFAETFRTTIDRVEGSRVAVDAGFFRGLSRNTQIDVSAGHTVAAGQRPAWFLTLGCVFRAPRLLALIH